jgi:glycosyltransferase involved in cell wall biosynthesis
MSSVRRRREYHRYAADAGLLIERYTPTKEDIDQMRGRRFAANHLISIVVPVYNPPGGMLQSAIESVREQVYKNWQLILVDDASTDSWVRPYLEELADADERIVVHFSKENEHIAKASNRGASLASGAFLAFLDQDDELAPHALYAAMDMLERYPESDLLYSNEDKITEAGKRFEPTLKPGWSREYLLSFMYLGHLMLYRKSLFDEVGGFQAAFSGAQDYDLALRATEKTKNIVHIPEILYHWRAHDGSVAFNKDSKGYAYDAGLRALQETLSRNEVSGKFAAVDGIQGVYRYLPDPEKMAVADSLVIFYGDMESDLLACDSGDIPSVRLLLGSCEPASDTVSAISSLKEGIRSVVSEKIQLDAVCLVDARSRVSDEYSLRTLLAYLALPGVCGVSPKITCGVRVLVGGMSLSHGVYRNHFFNAHVDQLGYGARLCAMHNVSVLSAAICGFRPDLLREVLKEPVSDAYELVLAYSLKSLQSNMRLVWTPGVCFEVPEAFIPATYRFERLCPDSELLDSDSVSKFTDLFYPVGLDTEQRNFRGAL